MPKAECGRCHQLENFEIEPAPYDLLLCKKCQSDIKVREGKRKALHEKIEMIELILGTLKEYVDSML